MKHPRDLVAALKERCLTITFVESCTGGFLASAITDVPGASEVFRGSFVTYSNSAKFRLGVDPDIIRKFTVYSKECAIAMAFAGLQQLPIADISVGVTGSFNRIDPQNPENSVPGEVYIAVVGGLCRETVKIHTLSENRHEAKKEVLQAVLDILDGVLKRRLL